MELEAACVQFLQRVGQARRLAPHTLAAYRNDLAQMTAYLRAHGVASAAAVSPAHLAGWLRHLAASGRQVSSQNRALSACRQLFMDLVRAGHVGQTPLAHLAAARAPRPLPAVPSVAAVAAVLAHAARGKTARARRNCALLEVLYGAGLRASEACGLGLRDLQLADGLVRVRGKGQRERLIPLGSSASAAVQRYLDGGRAALLGSGRSLYVFLGRRGAALSRTALYALVRRLSLAAGQPALTPHLLRHAFATHLLAGGADLRAVQALLGHASLATTEIYTHLDAAALTATVRMHHPLGAPSRAAR